MWNHFSSFSVVFSHYDVRFGSWSRWFLGLVFVVLESFLYFGVSYSSLESVFLVWSQLQASYFGVSYFSLESYLSLESDILVWSQLS